MAKDVPTRGARRRRSAGQEERLCRDCGGRVFVKALAAALPAVCPHCGAVVGPDLALVAAGGRERKALRSERRHHDLAVSWLTSAVLHVGVLTMVVLMAWPPHGASRRAPQGEREVSVVVPEDAPTIEAGPVGRMQLEPLAGELHVPRLKDSSEKQPAWDFSETSRSSSPISRIISIDVSSGGDMSAAMKGDWTDFAAGGGGQGEGAASFFGLEARGQKFVFVVDRSGSMAGPKLDAAKAELIRSVRALDRGAKFYTVFFNHTHTPMPAADLVRATEGSKRKHFAWVTTIGAEDGTNPTSAMKLALSLKPDAIWLLSDGIFDPRAAEVIKRANPGRKVQVHTLAFYSRKGEEVLQRIAEDNRGRYRFVSPASIGLGAGRR